MSTVKNTENSTALPFKPLGAMGLEWRAPTESDVEEIVALLKEQGDIYAVDEETLRAYGYERLNKIGDSHSSRMIVGTSAGKIRAFASVDQLPEIFGLHSYGMSCALHGDWLGQGIGQSMLTWQSSMAEYLHDLTGCKDKPVLTTHVDVANEVAKSLMLARAFYPSRQIQHLQIESDVRSVSLPRGITLEPFQEGLRPYLLEMNEPCVRTFGRTGVGEFGWKEAVNNALTAQSSLVVEDETSNMLGVCLTHYRSAPSEHKLAPAPTMDFIIFETEGVDLVALTEGFVSAAIYHAGAYPLRNVIIDMPPERAGDPERILQVPGLKHVRTELLFQDYFGPND